AGADLSHLAGAKQSEDRSAAEDRSSQKQSEDRSAAEDRSSQKQSEDRSAAEDRSSQKQSEDRSAAEDRSSQKQSEDRSAAEDRSSQKQSEDRSAAEGQPGLRSVYEGFLRVARSSLPTVAAVNGAAVGAGMNLALACDVRLAGRSARFDTRFLKLGLHPGGGHTWMLRR